MHNRLCFLLNPSGYRSGSGNDWNPCNQYGFIPVQLPKSAILHNCCLPGWSVWYDLLIDRKAIRTFGIPAQWQCTWSIPKQLNACHGYAAGRYHPAVLSPETDADNRWCDHAGVSWGGVREKRLRQHHWTCKIRRNRKNSAGWIRFDKVKQKIG